MSLLLALFLLAPPAVQGTRASVLILDTADRTRGLCVAISPSQCVTAYHVVKGHGYEFQLTDHQHKTFRGRLGWHDQGKDLAIVLVDATDLSSVRLGKRLPAETEDVWTWTIYEDRTVHLLEGKWAGARRVGSTTFHVVDGYSEPGTSGSVTFNSTGEGVAVLQNLSNAMADTRGAQYLRSLMLVRAIVGGIQ